MFNKYNQEALETQTKQQGGSRFMMNEEKYREQQVVNRHPSNVFIMIADMYCRLHIDPINL